MNWKLAVFLIFSSLLIFPDDASGQTYRSLVKALENPNAVVELILRHEKLTEIPSEVRQLKNLEILDLSKNHIRSLPDWLTELPRLHTLILSKNDIAHFPANLADAPALRVLMLQRNPIDSLPPAIEEFAKLEFLDLWDTELEYIDPAILKLNGLKFLDLRNTYFKTSELQWIIEGLPELELESSFGCNCD